MISVLWGLRFNSRPGPVPVSAFGLGVSRVEQKSPVLQPKSLATWIYVGGRFTYSWGQASAGEIIPRCSSGASWVTEHLRDQFFNCFAATQFCQQPGLISIALSRSAGETQESIATVAQ